VDLTKVFLSIKMPGLALDIVEGCRGGYSNEGYLPLIEASSFSHTSF